MEELGVTFFVAPTRNRVLRLGGGFQMEYTNKRTKYGWYIRLAPYGFLN